MKVILAAVSSLDGKITKGDTSGTQSWNSDEDHEYFTDLVAQSQLVIIGRPTYEVAKADMRHIPGLLRVVLTNSPEKYEKDAIPGQLEFTSETPKALVERLEKAGKTEALLAGGEMVYELFLSAGLVTDVWLTLEPKIFGSGKSLASDHLLDLSLKLQSVEKLNTAGTLLLKYEVL